jgi:hypothetical protein
VSFTDQPKFRSWRHIGCAIIVLLLLIANALFLLGWYLTYYDVSTDQYRALTINDLIVPIVIAGSCGIVWLYYRFLLRD